MAELHGLAAQITLVLGLVIVIWAVFLATTRRTIRPILAGALVWVVILLVTTGLLGAVQALAVKPPRDPLHIVYGLLAAAVLPGALLIARSSSDDARRSVLVLAAASFVLLILVMRLFQTGG